MCAGNESISVGLQARVSGGIGATNACTGMYRLAFIAAHGMRSNKVCRAALSRVSDGIGVANASTRMYWPGFLWSKDCETKSEWLRARLNWFISRKPSGHAIGMPISWLLLLAQAKEVARARTLQSLRSNASLSVRNPVSLNIKEMQCSPIIAPY